MTKIQKLSILPLLSTRCPKSKRGGEAKLAYQAFSEISQLITLVTCAVEAARRVVAKFVNVESLIKSSLNIAILTIFFGP